MTVCTFASGAAENSRLIKHCMHNHAPSAKCLEPTPTLNNINNRCVHFESKISPYNNSYVLLNDVDNYHASMFSAVWKKYFCFGHDWIYCQRFLPVYQINKC